MNNLDHDIGDLTGDTKFSPEQKKNCREKLALNRDAVHGELLKSMRSIDVMRGIVMDSLKYSPPRTQAESLRQRKQAERAAQRMMAGSCISSTGSGSAAGSPSQNSRASLSSSSRSSPHSASRGVHSPGAGSSAYYPNSQHRHSHSHNYSANMTAGSPSPTSAQLRTPRSLGGGSVGLSSRKRSPSPPVPPAPAAPGRDGHSSSLTRPVPTMPTDSSLPMEAISISCAQLTQSINMLRGRPDEAAAIDSTSVIDTSLRGRNQSQSSSTTKREDSPPRKVQLPR